MTDEKIEMISLHYYNCVNRRFSLENNNDT